MAGIVEMKFTVELYLLIVVIMFTATMWVPYVVARSFSKTSAGKDTLGLAYPAWGLRAKHAHINALENLAVFAPLVLIASLAAVSSPATVLAAKAYLAARIVHYGAYLAGMSLLRTLAFLAGWSATMAFAVSLISGTIA